MSTPAQEKQQRIVNGTQTALLVVIAAELGLMLVMLAMRAGA